MKTSRSVNEHHIGTVFFGSFEDKADMDKQIKLTDTGIIVLAK